MLHLMLRSTAVSAALGLALGSGLLQAPPANAHSSALAGPDAAHYRTAVTGLTPAVAGLSVAVEEHGEWIEMTNGTGEQVEVLGYAGEPYLRIGPSGVDENVASVSSFLNNGALGEVPADTGSSARPPSWVHRGDTSGYRWHDHRIHWVGLKRPPAVAANPGEPSRVNTWSIRLRVASAPVTVHGTLDWLGRSAWSTIWRGLGIILASFLLMIGVFVMAERRVRTGEKSPTPPNAPTVPVPRQRHVERNVDAKRRAGDGR